jgi:hypothetical protein
VIRLPCVLSLSYYPMFYRDHITLCYIVIRLPCVLSWSDYHVFYRYHITMCFILIISNSCSNSSKGSGGTAIFIIKTKGLKNFEIKNDRICCVLSLSYYHVFYLDQITMFDWFIHKNMTIHLNNQGIHHKTHGNMITITHRVIWSR